MILLRTVASRPTWLSINKDFLNCNYQTVLCSQPIVLSYISFSSITNQIGLLQTNLTPPVTLITGDYTHPVIIDLCMFVVAQEIFE